MPDEAAAAGRMFPFLRFPARAVSDHRRALHVRAQRRHSRTDRIGPSMREPSLDRSARARMHLACDVVCAPANAPIEMHDAIDVAHARTKRRAQLGEFARVFAARISLMAFPS
jgi:hypothetical protein